MHSHRILLILCRKSAFLMSHFSCVLAPVRDRVIPSLKDHSTSLGMASGAGTCREAVGHRGAFKCNALTTAEFDPLESNKQCLGKMFCHPFPLLSNQTLLFCV